MAQRTKLIIYLEEDLRENRSFLVEWIFLDEHFISLSIEDQISLIIANWNRAMIIYLLSVLKVEYFRYDEEIELSPVIEYRADYRAQLAEDDRPIVDCILTELFTDVIQFKLNSKDLEYLLISELFDTDQLYDKNIVEIELKDAYIAAVSDIVYNHKNYRNMCKLRQKTRDLSHQCKKRLFWEQSTSNMASWLEQKLAEICNKINN